MHTLIALYRTFAPLLPFLLLWLFLVSQRRWHRRLEALARELKSLTKKFDEVVDRVDHDYLTGAYSRLAGERRLKEAMRCFPCVVVFIDLDDFGLINKAHGWDKGDEALKEIASFLLARFRRAHDTVYRLGGDEFVVVLPALTPQPDRFADPQPPAQDPLHLTEAFAQENLRQIAQECPVAFTYGLATTRQWPAHRVLIEAQEEVRLARQRRDALREAAAEIDSAQAEAQS